MYESGGKLGAETLLIGGVVFQYIATRISVTVLGRADGSAPGQLAIGQWLPIAATTLAAVVMRQPLMAIALIFGSTVASLSLVLGMTTYVAPIGQLPPERRLWPLVLPAGLFLLLAGFRGHFTWYHALMLLIMGGFFLAVWMERPSPEASPAVSNPPTPTVDPWFILLAVLLAGSGAWMIVRGAVASSARMLTPELLGATILSPLLLLPSLGAGTMLAQNGHADRAVTSLCGTALLNLCLLLPIVILIEFVIGAIHGRPVSISFPLITWRVDTILLVVLGFALVPIAAGRWIPQRIEAILLVILYAAYLVAETALSVRLLG
jgi:Ca2+/Na+ antiporter